MLGKDKWKGNSHLDKNHKNWKTSKAKIIPVEQLKSQQFSKIAWLSGFFYNSNGNQKTMNCIFKALSKNNCQPTMEYVVKWSFKKGWKNNIYRLKENKITEFTTNRFLLMVILKNELQVEAIPNWKVTDAERNDQLRFL